MSRDEIGTKSLTAPLVLAVEVLSPSTRRKDRVLKFSKYADSGVASYWIVDPQAPSVAAYDLVDGAYAQVGKAAGVEALELDRPIPVTVRPADLLDI